MVQLKHKIENKNQNRKCLTAVTIKCFNPVLTGPKIKLGICVVLSSG